MADTTIYTLGHSDREPEEFLQVLVEADVRQLVDIRAVPQSRRFPHFDADVLRQLVEPLGIVYHLAGRAFGGRHEAKADSPHIGLEKGLRGFADHMETDAFTKSVDQLVHLAEHEGPLAVMCAERLPEQCHRRLLADYLQLRGVRVIHLIAPGESRTRALSPELRVVDGRLIYDRHATGELDLR